MCVPFPRASNLGAKALFVRDAHTCDLEIATAEWVDWFNRRRPLEYCDDLTPVEAVQAHYAHHQTPTPVGVSE